MIGLLRGVGISLMIGGAATIAGSTIYYFKGKTAGRAEVQAVYDKAVAEHNAAAIKASEENRRKESELAAKVKGAEDALAKERTAASKIAADLRRARTERDGLRDQIGAFAGGGGVSEDTLSAARDRAATLGRLLDESLQLQEELAGDAEALASEVRALRQSWPD